MKIHRYILAGLTALLMIAPCSVSAAIDPVTHREIKPVTAEAKDSGPVMIKGRMYYADSGNVTLYTGMVKGNDGTRFYLGGSRWFGWMKISGGWYYFDPKQDGKMATGTINTAAGTYKMSASGEWTGTLAKTAKAPADFRLVYTNTTDRGYIMFDTDGYLTNAPSSDTDDKDLYTAAIPVTEKDRQIMYDMLISCKADKVSGREKAPVQISASWSAGKASFGLDEAAYKDYGKDSGVTAAAYYRTFIESFIYSLPQYGRLEAEKENRGSQTNMMPEMSVQREVKAKIHQYSGKFAITDKTYVIHSTAEAQRFAKGYAAKQGHTGSKYLTQLLELDEEFFRSNVVLYTEYSGKEGDKFTAGKTYYDSEHNTYTTEIGVAQGKGGNTGYILLVEIEKPGGASPVVPIGKVKYN